MKGYFVCLTVLYYTDQLTYVLYIVCDYAWIQTGFALWGEGFVRSEDIGIQNRSVNLSKTGNTQGKVALLFGSEKYVILGENPIVPYETLLFIPLFIIELLYVYYNTMVKYCLSSFCELYLFKANSESLFETDLQRRLYPSHTYSHVFGGHPLHIVDLKVRNDVCMPCVLQHHILTLWISGKI